MSTTLERLESVEKSVAQALAATAQLQQGLSKFGEGLGRMASIQDSKVNSDKQYFQFILQKLQATESAVGSLSKMTVALLDELISTKAITNDAVVARMRNRDEAAEKTRVNQMLEANVIEAKETADASSLVVYSQVFVSTTPAADGTSAPEVKSTTITDYRMLELSNQGLPAAERDAFVGKKAGDAFELQDGENSKSLFKILAVYGLKEGPRAGEPAAPEAAAAAPEAPAEA